jgi:ABC-2 type transport system ATP-binding protein
MDTAAAIEVRGLTKTYRYHRKEPGLRGSVRALFRRRVRETRAVEGVSFAVRPGEVVGFLGPNGAGKTTILKVLCGLLHPSAGAVAVLGHTPHRREAAFLRRISLLTGQRSMLWRDLPALDTLRLHKVMYGVPEPAFRRTVAELAELLEVGPLLRVQVRKLSLGERMKLELMAALVHEPEVLFLDEPTLGLDVVAQQRVREFLGGLAHRRGTTVLLTSHYMADLEALCPRVLLIDRGRLRFDGPLPDLLARAAPEKLVRAVYAEPPAVDGALAGIQDGAGEGWRLAPEDDPRRLSLRATREAVPAVAARLLRLGRLVDLSVQAPPAEELVRTLFGQPPQPAGAPDGAPPGSAVEDTPAGEDTPAEERGASR